MKSFSLVNQPWLKVFTKDGQNKKISLIDFFKNAKNIVCLAGETKSQDLAVIRFLLAILYTVYSKIDNNNQKYSWEHLDNNFNVTKPTVVNTQDSTNLDKINHDKFQTWQQIYQQKHFTQGLINYLESHTNQFDLLNQERPFDQVNLDEYNQFLASTTKSGRKIPRLKTQDIKKAIKKATKDLTPSQAATKTLPGVKFNLIISTLKQEVNQSNNTPNIFKTQSNEVANTIKLPQLARELITLQEFADTSSKGISKFMNPKQVHPEKDIKASKGCLYSMHPIILKGDNLFETLMLNLKLDDSQTYLKNGNEYLVQEIPNWDYENTNQYLENNFYPNETLYTSKNTEQQRSVAPAPTNRANLYTSWSRIVYIYWNKNNPYLFVQKLPTIKLQDAQKLELMTTWKIWNKSDGTHTLPISYSPSYYTMKRPETTMWSNFGNYYPTNLDSNRNQNTPTTPLILKWLQKLEQTSTISLRHQNSIHLSHIGVVPHSATANNYAYQVNENLVSPSPIINELTSKNQPWLQLINQVVANTKNVLNDYKYLLFNIEKANEQAKPSDHTPDDKNRYQPINLDVGIIYSRLNQPFNDWLEHINYSNEPNIKPVTNWRNILRQQINTHLANFFNQLPSNIYNQTVPASKNQSITIAQAFNQFKKHFYYQFSSKGGIKL